MVVMEKIFRIKVLAKKTNNMIPMDVQFKRH